MTVDGLTASVLPGRRKSRSRSSEEGRKLTTCWCPITNQCGHLTVALGVDAELLPWPGTTAKRLLVPLTAC